MKRYLLFVAIGLALVFSSTISQAQKNETFKKKGYQLTFINDDPTLDPTLKKKLITTFFEVYPVLAKEFNKNTVKEVTFFIDTAYAGVAEAHAGRVRFSSKWFKSHPGDIDVVTHEVMHLVQAYPNESGPWWVTEGIADYVRYVYGVDNEGGGWKLPEYADSHSYTSSYRITARFLAWIENHVKKGLVKELDQAMRNKTYTPEIWSQKTGKTIDELWKDYSKNPVL